MKNSKLKNLITKIFFVLSFVCLETQGTDEIDKIDNIVRNYANNNKKDVELIVGRTQYSTNNMGLVYTKGENETTWSPISFVSQVQMNEIIKIEELQKFKDKGMLIWQPISPFEVKIDEKKLFKF